VESGLESALKYELIPIVRVLNRNGRPIFEIGASRCSKLGCAAGEQYILVAFQIKK
jgi:hypothetical protein